MSDAIGNLQLEVRRLQEELDAARSSQDIDDSVRGEFRAYRQSPGYAAVFKQSTPLVSVCISTYNRASLLVQRCLPSVLSQDYGRLEVVVVGDGCTDDTGAQIERLHDPRVKYLNLPEREDYPDDPLLRWMVAGSKAGNLAMEVATGDLITHIDDDDAYEKNRIQELVGLLQEQRAELVWHPFLSELPGGEWQVCPAEQFQRSQVTTGSVLYHAWLKRLPWDSEAYRYREPGDWNRFRKFKHLGVKMARHPGNLLRHHREGSQR
jgi:hypothetical protein